MIIPLLQIELGYLGAWLRTAKIKFCYSEALISTPLPVSALELEPCLSLSACARQSSEIKTKHKNHNFNEHSTASDLTLLFGNMITHYLTVFSHMLTVTVTLIGSSANAGTGVIWWQRDVNWKVPIRFEPV